MTKSQKIFATLFVISIFAILFGEDGMIKSFSLERFGVPFIFITFPLLLAYFFGWKKGFALSIATSGLFLVAVTFYYGDNAGEGWVLIYNVFFALFSLWYLIISALISFFINLENKKILFWPLFIIVVGSIFAYVMDKIGSNPF